EIDAMRAIPLDAALPMCEVVRTGQALVFEDRAALARRYPLALTQAATPYQACVILPVVVCRRAVGAVAFSFWQRRRISDEERELLTAMIGQASLAFERCMLLDAERRAREDAEAMRERERQLYLLGSSFASELEHDRLVQLITSE